MSTEFFQQNASLANQYDTDEILKSCLAKTLPAEVLSKVREHLRELGADAAGQLLEWSADADAHEPVLEQFDPFGKRIDRIILSSGWKKIEAYAAENGLIASGYERKYGEWSRVYQMSLLYLFHPSSSFVSCPLAMTDGAARLIEVYGDAELKKNAFAHLTSREAKKFWTSGQWMTEKTGGSDVGLSTTTAKKISGDEFALYGVKWFTSAVTSQMAMTLARPEGAEAGGRGLSLFYLETGSASGKLNNINVLRLKDKLGTRAMPTAELELVGARARLVGGEGGGIRKIATLFNISRIYNSVCSVAQMRRCLALAQDYSAKRVAFGQPLKEHGLFQERMADLLVQFEGSLTLVMRIVHLLGREEVGLATDSEKSILRLLTPVAKLMTAKIAVQVASEVVEMFGGAGYCEDTGIPRLLRDAQVFPIWEGATNVLSLDVLRALQKECSFAEFRAAVDVKGSAQLQVQMDGLERLFKDPNLQNSAGEFAWLLGRVYIGGLLAKNTDREQAVAKRWIRATQLPQAANSAETAVILQMGK